MVTPCKGVIEMLDSSEGKRWRQVWSQDLLSFRSLNQESIDAFQTARTSSLVDGRLAHIVLRKWHKISVTDRKAWWCTRTYVGASLQAELLTQTSLPPTHFYSNTWVSVPMRGGWNKHAVNSTSNLSFFFSAEFFLLADTTHKKTLRTEGTPGGFFFYAEHIQFLVMRFMTTVAHYIIVTH